MFNSFSAALSAMKAHSAAVDVVGNNLANMNTNGFKASSIAFKDMVSASLSAKTEVGMGLSSPIMVRNFSQGAIQSSTGKLDAALQGNGFFVVKDGNGGIYYTRDGGFKVDSSGIVRTQTGEKVQQFSAGMLQDIRISSASANATPTSTIMMNANLNAVSEVGEQFSTPVEVVDSLGARHTVTVTYTKAGDNEWDYVMTIPAGELQTGADPELGTGTVTFNQDGTFASVEPDAGSVGSPVTGQTVTVEGFLNGAADLTLTWSLLDAQDTPTLTQFAQASSPSKTSQDGFAAAELVDFGLADGGAIVARYGNGQERTIATLAVAAVANPDTLVSASNNLYRATSETAEPVASISGVGGRGNVRAQALEGSTVDMAREFTNLIIYQRGYQANSRVITTADELSQETLNLKR